MLTILLDGVAYGMLLFVLACGLSVTLGLMNFVNLAHGVLAMLGGYTLAIFLNHWNLSFFLGLIAAFAVAASAGLVLERLVYRHVYRRNHLDQVLLTIGVVFMAVAAFDYVFGAQPQVIRLPDVLKGRVDLGSSSIGVYRLFLIAVCGAIAILLQLFVVGTRFGRRLRAAVDDPEVAAGLGIDVDRIFAVTFALGSGLAGLGGALGAGVLGMDPYFPIKYLIYFLIIVAVGGTEGIMGALLAAVLLGIADVLGKYYWPQIGAFVIYGVMVLVLVARPHGLIGRAGAAR
jgi:branched-chain amino acid transport system permease protein